MGDHLNNEMGEKAQHRIDWDDVHSTILCEVYWFEDDLDMGIGVTKQLGRVSEKEGGGWAGHCRENGYD